MADKNTEFDRRKLRGKIIEVYGSCGAFAEAIGTTPSELSMKLSGGTRRITIADVPLWSKALGIDYKDIGEFFFCPKS